jgi:iron(III) transport system permease protein
MKSAYGLEPSTGLPIKLERIKNKTVRILMNPPVLISIILLVVLAYLVIAPLASMLQGAMMVHRRDRFNISGSSVGDFTTYYLKRVFASEMSQYIFYRPLLNTLMVALPMSALALLIGSVLAWLVTRTDLPCAKLLANLAVVPYILPSWTLSLAWLTLFKNRRVGGAAGILESFGIMLPDWISYGPIPIIITTALHYYPFTFLLIGSALRDFDARLEEAATVLGAPRNVIVRRIIILLIIPAILSALILTVSRGFGTFGGPAFLGGPVNFHVLSTMLYANLQTGSPGVAYIISLVMIGHSVLFVVLSNRFLGSRKSYATVGGRTPKANLMRYPIFFVVCLFIFTVVFVPILILGIDTIMQVPGRYTLENLSLHYWLGKSNPAINAGEPGVLRNPAILQAFWNSVRLGLFASLSCGALGILVGYTVVRLRGTRISSVLNQISFLPYLIPSMALGAIYLSLFSRPRGPIPSLYGTFTLLVLVVMVNNLPFSSRAGISAMMRLGNDIEEAGIVAGANWFTRMRRLIIPVQRNGFLAGLVLPFISGMRELSLIIILITPRTQVLSTTIFRYTDAGYYQLSNAVVLLLIFIVVVMTQLLQKVTKSDLAKGLGG